MLEQCGIFPLLIPPSRRQGRASSPPSCLVGGRALYLRRLIMIPMFGSGADQSKDSKATGCVSHLRQQSRERNWAALRAKNLQHSAENIGLAKTATRKLPPVGNTQCLWGKQSGLPICKAQKMSCIKPLQSWKNPLSICRGASQVGFLPTYHLCCLPHQPRKS